MGGLLVWVTFKLGDAWIERDVARASAETWARRYQEVATEMQRIPRRNPDTGRLERRPHNAHLDTLRSLLRAHI